MYTTTEAAAMLGVSPNTVKSAIKRGVLAHEAIHPRLNMVTLEAIETYRRERLGQRGGYRPGAGRRPQPSTEAPLLEASTAEDDPPTGGQGR